MKKTLFLPVLAALIALGGGCAPKNWSPEDDGVFDPFEGLNRETYKFNSAVDFLLFSPVAKVYYHFPAPVKTGVDNVFANLNEPANAVNNALQKDGTASFNSATRFAFNSVLGVAGVFDVASGMGIERREADLGQTLRAYGLRNTAYFMLPLLGPTTLADGIGRGGDSFLRPQTYIEHDKTRYTIYGVDAIHTRAGLLAADVLMDAAVLDEYIFVREAYEELRLQRVPTDLWGR